MLARLNPTARPIATSATGASRRSPCGTTCPHPTRDVSRARTDTSRSPAGPRRRAASDDPANDTFVAVRNDDGTASEFGGLDGTRVIDEAPGVADRGTGIAWRPGGDGPVALIDAATQPIGRHTVVLRAFHADGVEDLGFNRGNAVELGATGSIPSRRVSSPTAAGSG